MTGNEVCHTTMNLYSHFEIAFIYAKHITLDIAFRDEHKFQNIVKDITIYLSFGQNIVRYTNL